LTYIVPIVDHVMRNRPGDGRVRAIIVYPMNALINSQKLGIERFFANLPEAERVVRCERYTGQEREAEKKRIQQNPPHILLTNYVMLELMLTRRTSSHLWMPVRRRCSLWCSTSYTPTAVGRAPTWPC
jgi:ATP-dependent helicase YprA (DUF1998 family)